MSKFKVGDKVRFVKRNLCVEEEFGLVSGAYVEHLNLKLRQIYIVSHVTATPSIKLEGVAPALNLNPNHFVKARKQS